MDPLASKLRSAAKRPENWDIPNLLIDAAARIESLQRTITEIHTGLAEIGEAMAEFSLHSN